MRKILLIILSVTILITDSLAINIQSKEISINKNQIHYYQIGDNIDKPNLVMLTGIGTTANFWPKDFINILSQKYNLYLLDYRSMNTQEDGSKLNYSINNLANDTNMLIEKLNLKDLCILGWSMGGAVALQTVYDNKNSFNQIFLISPGLPTTKGNLKKPSAPFKTKSDIYNFVFKNNLYGYKNKNLDIEIKRFIDPNITHLFPTKQEYAKQKIALKNWTTNPLNLEKFKNIQTPTVIFLGKQDTILDPQKSQNIIDMVKNKSYVDIIYFNKSGHAIDWNYPNKLANIINAFSYND